MTDKVLLVDVASLVAYIKNVFIGANAAALDEALAQSSHTDCIQKFISDPQVPMLVIDRIISRDDTSEETTAIVRIANETAKRTERTTSLLLLKCGSFIEADKTVEDQLYVLRFVLSLF
ncbi:unnamed protein product [Gongylonema pulchrum]|uniref:Response regulatory domain-containing protein n=1 Tax=Gongylonema pulchrum TaxID=637853 RepID=A0A183EQ20_9BILA|nr:unnamed protein product [Gongylonema pulchrum]